MKYLLLFLSLLFLTTNLLTVQAQEEVPINGQGVDQFINSGPSSSASPKTLSPREETTNIDIEAVSNDTNDSLDAPRTSVKSDLLTVKLISVNIVLTLLTLVVVIVAMRKNK